MPPAKPRDAKSVIMAGALFATGVFEFMERLEDGQPVHKAAKGAIDATVARGEVIQERARKLTEDDDIRVREKRPRRERRR